MGDSKRCSASIRAQLSHILLRFQRTWWTTPRTLRWRRSSEVPFLIATSLFDHNLLPARELLRLTPQLDPITCTDKVKSIIYPWAPMVRRYHKDILATLPLIYLHTQTAIMVTRFIRWRLRRSLRIKPEASSANSWNLRVILSFNSNLPRAARVPVSTIRIWSRHKVIGDTPLSWKVSTKISRPSLLTKARVKLPDMYMVVPPLIINTTSVLWVPI